MAATHAGHCANMGVHPWLRYIVVFGEEVYLVRDTGTGGTTSGESGDCAYDDQACDVRFCVRETQFSDRRYVVFHGGLELNGLWATVSEVRRERPKRAFVTDHQERILVGP